jgi:hypothetical protein
MGWGSGARSVQVQTTCSSQTPTGRVASLQSHSSTGERALKPALFSNLEFGSAQHKRLVLAICPLCPAAELASYPAMHLAAPLQTDSEFAMYIFPLPTVACSLLCTVQYL